ncbi:hypothetical protein CH373_06935 [Leptospira perolatii]|uniref:Uncharacterized protein n=1 Tax=Leptospira perolatii TaxID=2023191 RepID=A0A2M9ZPP9_9LEPT|nr:hypothetical protein [Leptospira perolatii]PJZ70923.1 hypothetical protein CH360_03795 [Leptospira perolatii]PJZ74046.1 hypothetical protein CH373_06935 [Leptospira perolatii]
MFGLTAFLSGTNLFSNVPTYHQADKILVSTWNRTFPVPFSKILKRNLNGQGILAYRKDSKSVVYIYTYLVFLPLYAEENEKPVPKDSGREVKVKLIFQPDSPGEKYEIQFGEFDEAYDKKRIMKWIP